MSEKTNQLLAMLDGMETALADVVVNPTPDITTPATPLRVIEPRTPEVAIVNPPAGNAEAGDAEAGHPESVDALDEEPRSGPVMLVDPFLAVRTTHDDVPPPLRVPRAAHGSTARVLSSFGWEDAS